jgi:hypothetical protein
MVVKQKVTNNVSTVRITQFTPELTTAKLQNAVLRVHESVSTTFFLSKLIILQEYTNLSAKYSTTKEVCDEFTKWSNTIGPFKKDFFRHLLSVVSSDVTKRRGPPFKDMETILFYDKCYKQFANMGYLSQEKVNGCNLSHIFDYVETNFLVSYKNNIQCHFDKYVKKYIRMIVSQIFLDFYGVASKYDLPEGKQGELTKYLNICVKYVLYKGNAPENICERNIVNVLNEQVIHQVLPNADTEMLFYNLKAKPEIFLPYMIHMNRCFELNGIKQYSPLPLRTDFIPKNICIDTIALVDIMIDGDFTVEMLKNQISLLTGWDLTLFKDKGYFFKDVTKLLKNAPSTITSEDFKSVIWKVFTKLGESSLKKRLEKLKQKKDMVFNNMVMTDGYKVDIHLVNSGAFYLKRFTKGTKIERVVNKDEFLYVQKIEDSLRDELLTTENYTKLYCDPGKGNIVTISDGTNNVVRYTSVQRAVESSAKRNKRELENLKKNTISSDISIQTIICGLTDTSSKSCFLDSFGKYLKKRSSCFDVLHDFFLKDSHRRRRYRARLGRQSSEDKLKNMIQEKFGIPEKKIVIFWGNWGRNPNMKHQSPSPGIGLRRRLHKQFQTFTLDERNTSSRCPNCASDVYHPMKRTVTKNEKSRESNIHHLLCCKNNNCESKWWNRDILAVCNFTKQVDSYLTSKKPHKDFALRKKS